MSNWALNWPKILSIKKKSLKTRLKKERQIAKVI